MRFIRARFISNEERFTRRFKKVMAIEAKYQCGDGSSEPAWAFHSDSEATRQRTVKRESNATANPWSAQQTFALCTAVQRDADVPLRRNPLRRRRSPADQWLGPSRTRDGAGAVSSGSWPSLRRGTPARMTRGSGTRSTVKEYWTRRCFMSRAAFRTMSFLRRSVRSRSCCPMERWESSRNWRHPISACWAC